MAEKCEIELAYAIGVAEPISVLVDTFGTGKISDEDLAELVNNNFDLRPVGIIKKFDLRNLPAKMVVNSIKNLLLMVTWAELTLMFHGKKQIKQKY